MTPFLSVLLAAAAPTLAAPVAAAPPLIDFDGLTGKAFVLPALTPLPAERGEVPARRLAGGEGIGPLVFSASSSDLIPDSTLFSTLAKADLVYAGEQHDQPSHHRLQSEILKRLRGLRRDVSVGLEMLDLTQQPTLDAFLSGRMSEPEFAAFWKKSWGYGYELYQPVLGYARAAGLRVRALNAPLPIVRQVVKGGLGSLSPEQRRLLPAVIRPITDPRYLDYVRRSLREHGPMPPGQEARMLEAMAVWNETMGQSLSDALAGGGQVVVIAGMGHMLYRAGILESVRHRSGAAQAVVLPYPFDGPVKPAEELLRALQDPASEDIHAADYFWLNP